MDASSINTVDNIELETLTLAYIQTLKESTIKWDRRSFFRLVLESPESDIYKKSFD